MFKSLNRGISTPIAIIIIVVLAIILVGGLSYYYCWLPKVNLTPNQTGETADWKTYTNTQLGILFSYPKDWGEVIENNQGYNGYNLTFSFPNRKVADINSGFMSIREATIDELYFLKSSKTEESVGGIKFYINDYIAKGNLLDRVYAFQNKNGDTILIWFGTNRSAGILNEIKNQKIFDEINEYQDFNQMLSTFKFLQ